MESFLNFLFIFDILKHALCLCGYMCVLISFPKLYLYSALSFYIALEFCIILSLFVQIFYLYFSFPPRWLLQRNRCFCSCLSLGSFPLLFPSVLWTYLGVLFCYFSNHCLDCWACWTLWRLKVGWFLFVPCCLSPLNALSNFPSLQRHLSCPLHLKLLLFMVEVTALCPSKSFFMMLAFLQGRLPWEFIIMFLDIQFPYLLMLQMRLAGAWLGRKYLRGAALICHRLNPPFPCLSLPVWLLT